MSEWEDNVSRFGVEYKSLSFVLIECSLFLSPHQDDAGKSFGQASYGDGGGDDGQENGYGERRGGGFRGMWWLTARKEFGRI